MEIAELIIKAAAAYLALLIMWDVSRRHFQRYSVSVRDVDSKVTKIESSVSELHGSNNRRYSEIVAAETDSKRRDEELSKRLDESIRLMRERIDSVYEKFEAEKATAGRPLNELSEKVRQLDKDATASAEAIKGLWERCEKNSKALENTAANLQQTLNEKFSGAALRGAFNPQGVTR